MTYLDKIEEVSKQVKIAPEVVKEAYKIYWSFIRKTIQEIPLKDIWSEEEFNKYRTTFNIPSLGKLVVTWDSLSRFKNNYKTRQHDKNK